MTNGASPRRCLKNQAHFKRKCMEMFMILAIVHTWSKKGSLGPNIPPPKLCLPWRPTSTQLGFDINNTGRVGRPGQWKPCVNPVSRAAAKTCRSTLGKVSLAAGHHGTFQGCSIRLNYTGFHFPSTQYVSATVLAGGDTEVNETHTIPSFLGPTFW